MSEVLLEKSSENEDAARLCKDNGKFNDAVSRYYYSLYQRIIYIIHQNDDLDPKTFMSQNGIDNSHQNTIQKLIEYYGGKDNNMVMKLTILDKLRKMRSKADYSEKVFGKEDIKYILEDYNLVKIYLMRVIGK